MADIPPRFDALPDALALALARWPHARDALAFVYAVTIEGETTITPDVLRVAGHRVQALPVPAFTLQYTPPERATG